MSLDPNNPLTPRTNEAEKRLQQKEVLNKVINGGFDFWQRGTSLSLPASGKRYLPDRFWGQQDNDGGADLEQYTDVPSELSGKFNYSLGCVITAADASMTGDQFLNLAHSFEGNFVKDLYGKDVVISFWVKTSLAGTYSVILRDASANSYQYGFEYTIDTANTWQKITKVVNLDNSFGTWNQDNNTGFEILWSLGCGPDREISVLDQWSSGEVGAAIGTSNQVNLMATIGNSFQLAGVMLYDAKSGEDVEFQRAGRNYAEELQLCQRYFQKSYEVDTPIGTVTTIGSIQNRMNTGFNDVVRHNVYFICNMRAACVGEVYSPDTGTAGRIRTDGSNETSSSTNQEGDSSMGCFTNVVIGSNQAYRFHWSADAEL